MINYDELFFSDEKPAQKEELKGQPTKNKDLLDSFANYQAVSQPIESKPPEPQIVQEATTEPVDEPVENKQVAVESEPEKDDRQSEPEPVEPQVQETSKAEVHQEKQEEIVDVDHMQTSQGKELIPGKTAIGKITGKLGGKPEKFIIFYGNVSEPKIQGESLRIKNEEQYILLVNNYCNSHPEFRRPSREEILEVQQNLINEEKETEFYKKKEQEELEKKQAEEKAEKEKQRRDEADISKAREVKDLRDRVESSEALLVKATKKAKIGIIIAVIALLIALVSCVGIGYLVTYINNQGLFATPI